MTRDRKQTEKFPAVTDLGSTPPPSSPGTGGSRLQRPLSRPSGIPVAGPGTPRPSMIELEWLKEEDTNVTRTTEAAIEIPAQIREKNRALLTVTNGFNAGQVFTLEERETIIGRGRDVTVRLEDAGVSRQHTRIVKALDGRYFVEDLQSTNGTFVAGRRIERSEIQSGDHVQIGPNVSLSFALIDEKAEQLAKQLFESSTRDALTQVFNRRYLAERLAGEVAYANRHKTHLGVVLFDLDHFKKVNDTYGHLAGDEVLKAVAASVAKMIRVEDVLARFGGEEFVVIVRGIEHLNVSLFADRIRRAVEKIAVTYEAATIRPTVSVGVASLNECGDMGTGEALLLLSDERLYQAKNQGRNRVISS